MEDEFEERSPCGADGGSGDDYGNGLRESVGQSSVDGIAGVSVVDEVNANNDGVEIVQDGSMAGWLKVKMGRQVWENIRKIFPNLPEESPVVNLVAEIHAQNAYTFIGQLIVDGEKYPVQIIFCFPYLNCEYDGASQLSSMSLDSPQCSVMVDLGALTSNTARQVHLSLISSQLGGLQMNYRLYFDSLKEGDPLKVKVSKKGNGHG